MYTKPNWLYFINRKIIICFIASLAGVFSQAFAQMNNIWMLGYNPTLFPGYSIYSLDFKTSPITVTSFPNAHFGFSDCNASICDSAGNLLFYTNGLSVLNSLNDTMVNGDNLSLGIDDYLDPQTGEQLPQAAIVIPDPSNLNYYYIIHGGYYEADYCDTLYYSIVDMEQDSGKGAVIEKNQLLWVGNRTNHDLVTWGSITACKHANGRDWWIVKHKDFENTIITFLLTPQGIALNNIQAIGPVLRYFGGQAVFSPDGTKYAFYCPSIAKKVHIFDFDRCTGHFSHHQSILNLPDTTYGSVGIAFSPNSRFLYTSSLTEVNQFDTWSSNMPSTKILVAESDTIGCPFWVAFYLMQLASDGKIYISSTNSSYCFSVINYPDSMGLSCQAVPHGFSNLPFYNFTSVPNYPNYYLGPVAGSQCDSLTGISNTILSLKAFSINPNPNKGEFTINYQLPGNVDGYLEIFNAVGELILKEPLPPWSSVHKTQLKNASKGIYFCRISAKGKSAGAKFVVD